MTLRRRGLSVITLEASSIVAWWCWVGAGTVSTVDVDVEGIFVDGGFGRVVSHFHVALPAVVFSLLDHTILTPPVEAVRRAIAPFVMRASSSASNAVAVASLLASNAFFAAVTARTSRDCFVGDLRGLPTLLLAGEGGAEGERAED